MAIAAGLLAGCGDYEPPVASRADTPTFAKVLADCQADGAKRADMDAKKRFHTFVLYGVSVPLAERRLITECVRAHGFAEPG